MSLQLDQFFLIVESDYSQLAFLNLTLFMYLATAP